MCSAFIQLALQYGKEGNTITSKLPSEIKAFCSRYQGIIGNYILVTRVASKCSVFMLTVCNVAQNFFYFRVHIYEK